MSTNVPPSNTILATAVDLLKQAKLLAAELETRSMKHPSLEVGSSSDLWETHEKDIENTRAAILKLTQRLEKLVLGPHGFLHEYVSINWEHGALYTLVDNDIFETIPIGGPPMSVTILADRSGIPSDKLLRICRLVACSGILQEPVEGFFGHTVISESLVKDQGFKSFVGFQLLETRVASTALSGSFTKSNPYWTGQAAFDFAWGMSMYEWHAKNERHGKRFAEAMKSVSAGLDPANGMITDFLSTFPGTHSGPGTLLAEVCGKTGDFSRQLATKFPLLRFEVQDGSEKLIEQGRNTLPSGLAGRITYRNHDLFKDQDIFGDVETGSQKSQTKIGIFLLRTALWSLPDEACVKVLRTFENALRHRPEGGARPAVLLINDLVSPRYGSFESNAERAYRRRDVTLMTMHNAKQRTSLEWLAIIQEALPDSRITYSEKASSHSCRGMWAIQLL